MSIFLSLVCLQSATYDFLFLSFVESAFIQRMLSFKGISTILPPELVEIEIFGCSCATFPQLTILDLILQWCIQASSLLCIQT